MNSLPKTRTGISGLDDITLGGIPQGRPTLICGGPGCGKTLFSIEFLVNGATLFKEPGVFVTFEEKTEELTMNVASLGFDLEKLQKEKKLRLDYIRIERSEIEETGEYDLDGLFIRLEHAIDSIDAKRVVLDTIENLFAGLTNEGILRAELRRLFLWLKEKGVTAIITGEQGDGKLTRHGLEEYVSDCVILLDHRVINQISTRRLRIVKYRGSAHGTNEFPFLIDEDGISVLPVTYVKKGLLEFHSARPALYGLEMHLSSIYKTIKKFKPTTVVLDPITNLVSVGLINEVNSMLLRLIDFLQGEGITVMMTALMKVMDERMEEGVSSLVDTWISLKDIEANGERNKVLYIMKSSGMKHSNQVREFIMSNRGLHLVEIYVGPNAILLGSA